MLVSITTIAIYRAAITDHDHLLFYVTLTAFLTGTMLATSIFSWRTVQLFSLIYGGFVCTLLIGRSYLANTAAWHTRLMLILTAQYHWLSSGSIVRTPVVFTTQAATILWALSHSAAFWSLRSTKIWRIILPAGLILLTVVYDYAGPRPLWGWFALYIIISLLLITATSTHQQQTEWHARNIFYEPSLPRKTLKHSLFIACATLFFALQIPTLEAATPHFNSWLNTAQTWEKFTSAMQTTTGRHTTSTNGRFAQILRLDGRRSVSETLIMDITLSAEPSHIYWPAISYLTYADGGWHLPDAQQLGADDPIRPQLKSRQLITQTVQNYLPNTTQLYGLPMIISTDIATQAPDGYTQNHSLKTAEALQQGDRYTSTSLVSIATPTELRAAGKAYPTWAKSYITLPHTITQRTRALAETITADQNNPYDQAIAIEAFLRQHIGYNEQIDPPPADVDPVDHLLFEQPEGYCTYYTSAMVVMLRHLGIPARPVSGFAAGEYLPESDSYRVRASDAHSWVEVWFPDYGWIQFEPTATRSLPDRTENDTAFLEPAMPELDSDQPEQSPDESDAITEPEAAPEVAPTAQPAGQPAPSAQAFSRFTTGAAVIPLLFSLSAVGVSVIGRQRQKQNEWQQSYQRLNRWGERLGATIHRSQTPTERAAALCRIIPAGEKPIHRLTHHFVRSRYSQQRTAAVDLDTRAEWDTLRPILRRTWLRQRLDHWINIES